jgi:hypothetical protein
VVSYSNAFYLIIIAFIDGKTNACGVYKDKFKALPGLADSEIRKNHKILDTDIFYSLASVDFEDALCPKGTRIPTQNKSFRIRYAAVRGKFRDASIHCVSRSNLRLAVSIAPLPILIARNSIRNEKK